MSVYPQSHGSAIRHVDGAITVQNGRGDFVIDDAATARPEILAAASAAGTPFTTVSDGPARRVRRTWLDTFDWRLYRAGLALEQKSGHGGTELILTGRDGEQLASLPVPAGGNGSGPPSWPSLTSALP